MKKILALFFIPAACLALGTYVLQNGVWYNTTTGQTFYASNASTYPPGVNTFTATPTVTNTPTATNTPTPTPTSTPQSYVPNSVATFVGGSYKGSGPTFTPTFTPTPPSASAAPDFALVGKSLGSGIGVTPTPAISGGFLTIYHPSHGYNSGDYVVLAGITASPTPQYGLDALVPVATAINTNLYNVAVAGSGNVSGSALEMFWFSGTRSLNPLLLQNLTRSGTGNYVGSWTNTQNDSFYGLSFQVENSSNLVHAVLWSTTHPNTTSNFGIVVVNPTGASNFDSDQLLGIYGIGIK